jgi:hypothetical protein
MSLRTQLADVVREDLPKAVFVGAVVFFVVFVLSAKAKSDETFVVVNKTTPAVSFVVVNKTTQPTLPTDPSQPAPAGYQWIKYGSDPWKLEKLTTVPGGAVQRPFPADTIPRTLAPPAGGSSLSLTGSTGTVRTGTGVLWTERFGSTNCPPSG